MLSRQSGRYVTIATTKTRCVRSSRNLNLGCFPLKLTWEVLILNLNQVLMSKLNQVIHLELITESGMNPSNLQMWIRTKMKYK